MENLIQNILVLTDFSDAALNAARYAASLSSRLGASRILLYYSDYIPATIDIPLQNAIREEHEWRRNENKLKDWRTELKLCAGDDVAIDIRIDERPLDFAVKELGKDPANGLIVMGITGKNRLEQVLIGSNTINVAESCTLPLLIVPEEAIYTGISKVVFACDLKVNTPIPYPAIKNFVELLDANLMILNVDEYEEHRFNPEIKAEEEKIKAVWGADASYHFSRHEDVATGITSFALEHNAELIITVPKEYGFFEKLFHRSVTKKMAYHTHIPLLFFKS